MRAWANGRYGQALMSPVYLTQLEDSLVDQEAAPFCPVQEAGGALPGDQASAAPCELPSLLLQQRHVTRVPPLVGLEHPRLDLTVLEPLEILAELRTQSPSLRGCEALEPLGGLELVIHGHREAVAWVLGEAGHVWAVARYVRQWERGPSRWLR